MVSEVGAGSAHANRGDRDAAARYAKRAADWRCGAVVYQVLVDRFAPSADLDAKRHLYPAPQTLRGWHELPRQGHFVDSHRLWSHEIDFWGGDLASLRARLGHVQQLGADVLYLNPICAAFTNHKYDAIDYAAVSPEYGSREDVKALAADLHARGMKLVLDGVFNHMGRQSPAFQAALANPTGPQRNWFVFGDEFPGGARCWWRAENLPELNLENPAVRDHLWRGHDSIVRGWLRDGADGWRLDVAFDIGFNFLAELTQSAHETKPGSLVVGEIPNYPDQWFPSVDGVMHFALRHLIVRLCEGRLSTAQFSRLLARLVADCGTDNLLCSWIYLDNHDTPRLATALPDERSRRLAQLLQFTLPGAPNLYYGSEVDMEGGADPEMRAPMRWDLVEAGSTPGSALDWTRRLCALRRERRALRIGDWRPIDAERLLAFERHTDHAADSVLVFINPSDDSVEETVLVPDAKLMDGTRMIDLLGNADGPLPSLAAALMTLRVPPQSGLLLAPDTSPQGGYSNYKRVQ